ncbi:MAG: cobalamin-dependent protein [Pseudomonadota bacterium]
MRNRQGTDRIDHTEGSTRWAGSADSEDSGDQEGDHRPAGDDAWNQLESTIEGEIVPRLMMAFQQPSSLPITTPVATDATTRLDDFVELILAGDTPAAIGFIRQVYGVGSSLKPSYLNLITDCARQLGSLWDEDRCSFFDVTAGITRLRQIMLELSPQFCSSNRHEVREGLHALILPVPGDQHTLGQSTVVESFRRAGWNVQAGTSETVGAITQLVERQHFDVIGLSVSADRFVDDLGPIITRIREASCNPKLKVLIGGRSVAARDGLADELGADATAGDGHAAVAAAERLVCH